MIINCILLPNILSQRFSGGWRSELFLCFQLVNGCTVLNKIRHYGPLVIQKIFYPEGGVPHIYLLYPPGGIVGGDVLIIDVCLFSGAHVLFTTPSATRYYRSDKVYSIVTQKFFIDVNSSLEWLPQCNIFFEAAKSIIDISFILQEGARFIGYDVLCIGHIVNKKYCTVINVDIKLTIILFDSVGLHEHLRIDDSYLIKFMGCSMSGILFATPVNKYILDVIYDFIKKNDYLIIGATLLDKLLIVRILGNDGYQLNNVLREIWSLLRPFIMGCDAVYPRIWST